MNMISLWNSVGPHSCQFDALQPECPSFLFLPLAPISAKEIADNGALVQKGSVLSLVLDFLREIAQKALEVSDENDMYQTLKRTFRLFHQLSQTDKQTFTLAQELSNLWAHKEGKGHNGNNPNLEVLKLIHFMAQESPPSDFLEAFHKWTTNHDWPEDTVAILQRVLKRGTKVALSAELSGSLLRLRRARQRMKLGAEGVFSNRSNFPSENLDPEPTVWGMMSKGLIAIDK
jgi:hypothetical protein